MTQLEAPKLLNGEYPETRDELEPIVQERNTLFDRMARRATHLIVPPDMWQTMYIWNSNPHDVVPAPAGRDYTKRIYGLQVLIGSKFDILSAQTASLDHHDLGVLKNEFTFDSLNAALTRALPQFPGARPNYIVIPSAFESRLMTFVESGAACPSHRLINATWRGARFLIGDQFQILRGINGKEA